MIRAAIVDDSATMRAIIRRALERDGDIEVVGEAADPLEARQLIKDLSPDVITLDIEMPGMSGLDFLRRLMQLRPLPVVMVSSLTSRGAEATLLAFELGAVECVAKPCLHQHESFSRLASIVKAAAKARVRPLVASAVSASPASFKPNGNILAIGASTGGVEALLTVLSAFPQNCPPTVITQHMPATFTASFARRLDRTCAASVAEAYDGAPLLPGHVYVAPGGATHLEVTGSRTAGWRCRLVERDPVNGHRPSVDVLFASVAHCAGGQAVALLLTGMGRDGAQGMLALHRAGARTFAQDEATCVVYGMPRAAVELGAAQSQVPLQVAASAVLAACIASGD